MALMTCILLSCLGCLRHERLLVIHRDCENSSLEPSRCNEINSPSLLSKRNQYKSDHGKKAIPSFHAVNDTQSAHPEQVNASIIVQLSGEMGNNLHRIAFARGMQLLARERGIETNLVFRHKEDLKWRVARSLITRCFPRLREFDFEAGNSAQYNNRVLQQRLMFGARGAGLTIRSKSDESVRTVLETLQLLVNETSNNSSLDAYQHSTIKIPFIYSDAMVSHAFLDRYKDDFQKFFLFDDEGCCAQFPGPDESVFHFRNFQGELKDDTQRLGFLELGPNQTARGLFRGLSPGHKVAMITRFKNEQAQRYVDAMEEQGLQVRLISGQSPVEDFCFLKNAKKEMVGTEISSFFIWAAFLGESKVRSYFVESNRGAGKKSHYEWNDPALRARYEYESFLQDD
jgi:hypothetical protein